MIQAIIDFVKSNPRLVIGNAVGLLSALCAFISYQMKEPKKLIFCQIGCSGFVGISYAIIGAWTGMALNIVCTLRNISYLFLDRKPFSHKAYPYVVAVILAGIGVLSWEGPISLLPMAGLIIYTIMLSLGDNKKLRISILFTSTLVLIYDLIVREYVPGIMELMSIISAAVGLIRFRNTAE